VKDLYRLIITIIIACTLIGIISFFLNNNKQYSIEEIDKLITNEPYEKTFEDVIGIDLLGESASSLLKFLR
jgi:ATP-dependent Zn protease